VGSKGTSQCTAIGGEFPRKWDTFAHLTVISACDFAHKRPEYGEKSETPRRQEDAFPRPSSVCAPECQSFFPCRIV